MPAPLRVRLEQEVREAVAERYESARTPIERTNCHVVLLADEGRTVTEIAWLVRRGPGRTGAAQAHRATAGRDASLASRVAAGHRPHPHTVGVDSAVWTTRLLA